MSGADFFWLFYFATKFSAMLALGMFDNLI